MLRRLMVNTHWRCGIQSITENSNVAKILGIQVRPFSILPLKTLRNIGISAHIDTGKTTMTERILYYAGRINDIHEVKGSDQVGAKMDFMELERERGITIRSACTNVKWKGHHLNIIDTPGHVDFTIEVERALRVLDGAIMLICGVSGIQPQSITVHRQMERYKVPRIIFINKLDRPGSNYIRALEAIRSRLLRQSCLVNIPIGSEKEISGLVDLVEEKAYSHEGHFGEILNEIDIPSNMKKFCADQRRELVETVAELDEELADAFLSDENVKPDILKKAIRRQTLARTFYPVHCGSALKNFGVQFALNSVVDYLPCPTDISNVGLDYSDPATPEIPMILDEKKEFVGFAFKLDETKYGQLTYIRIYQGKARRGEMMLNTSNNKRVKITRMVRMHADEMEDINECGPGDIFGVFGLECNTGDTFTSSSKIKMPQMHIPEPVMSLSIAPQKTGDATKFMKALKRFQREDPTFILDQDNESEELVISGMGELHLNIYTERIKREYGIQVRCSQPTVNYRETIGTRYDFNYLHKKQTGGAGQFARVIGYIEPIPPEEATERTCQFENKTKGQNLPHEYIPAIQKAFYECVEKGPQTGFPVVNTRFVLTDGEIHSVDSSSHAFMIATRGAFREAFIEANPIILQPVMKVEVTGPARFESTVTGMILKRGAEIKDNVIKDDLFILTVEVPLANMFGYSAELRGQTQGTGEFMMDYIRHDEMSEADARRVRASFKKRKKKEVRGR